MYFIFYDRNSEHVTESATTNLVQHLNKRHDADSSDEEDSDSFEDDDNASFHKNNSNNHINTKEMVARSSSSFRLVTRLPSRYSPSKMNSTDEFVSKMLSILWNESDDIDVAQLIDDSDDENSNHDNEHDEQIIGTVNVEKSANEADCSRASGHPDNEIESLPIVNPITEDDLNDIHQSTLEYERQQFRGIQFANAGHTNPKVVNSYAMTSHTCSLF